MEALMYENCLEIIEHWKYSISHIVSIFSGASRFHIEY